MNWIEFQFNYQIKFNNWIKNKWDANWWQIYSKSSCKYDVGGKKKLNPNLKRHFSMSLHLRID